MTSAFEWRTLRERCESIDPESVLVAPGSERPFRVVSTGDDRITIEYVDGDGERILWRDQFDVLDDRIATDASGLPITDLPPGVEPYVSVLSISPQYEVDDAGRTIVRAGSDDAEGSPFLRPEWTARAPPERVHDDALLLADALERDDASDPESLGPGVLVDLYVLLSDVQHGADRLRRDVGDVLLQHVGPDARVHGRFGTVRRTTRERRRLKDDATVLSALDELDVPREWVLGVDASKLDVVLAVTDLEEDDVYDVEEQVYAQKTQVEEAEKQTRLQGLRDRLVEAEGEPVDEIRADIEDLENRIDALLAGS